MKKTKGQAALEFLTTYGWAILIVLVMIGALAYFGVINPKKFLPEKCIFTTGMTCEDYRVSMDGIGQQKLELTFKNSLGKSINVLEVKIEPDFPSTTVTGCTVPGVVKTDDKGNFECTFQGSYEEGSDIKIDISIIYKDVRGQYNHTIEGDLFTKVQP